MGLADILSNPGIIGLAMAGLSRDPQAPVRTMNVLQGANEMNRQAAQDEEKKLQRADTIALMQALMQNQQTQRTNPLEMLSKIKQYEKIDALPDTVTSFTPDQATGTATDYETGKSYIPKETDNTGKLEATKRWFESASKTNHPAEAAVAFSKYPNADPNFVLKYMQDHYNMKKEESSTLLKLVLENQKEKATLARDETKSNLDFERQKKLKEMEIAAKKDNPDMNPQLVGHTVGGKGIPGGLPVSYRNGKQYIVANGQEIPYDGPIKPKVDQPIFPPINNFIGTDPNGNLLGWNARGGGLTASPGPEGGVFPKTRHPLGEKAETALTGALDSIEMLNAIEKNAKSQSVGVPGVGQAIGWVKSKTGNEGAQEFDTNIAQLRVNAQNIIKGIPSNFDVQTFIKTLPGFDKTEKENLARIKLSKKYLANTIKTGLQNYEKSNFNIPDYLKERAGQLLSGAEQPIETGKEQPAQQGQTSVNQQTKPKTWDQLKQKYQQE